MHVIFVFFNMASMLNLSRHWLFRHEDPREFTRQKGGGAGTAVRAVRSFQRIKMTRGAKEKKKDDQRIKI